MFKPTDAPGIPVGKLHDRVIAGRAVGKQFGGPKLKDGNANDDVFVIVGVTLAMAVKASG